MSAIPLQTVEIYPDVTPEVPRLYSDHITISNLNKSTLNLQCPFKEKFTNLRLFVDGFMHDANVVLL